MDERRIKLKRMVLTKLTLSGAEKKDASLIFKMGLNVISGDSDTGKTYAFQCLNYILGAEKIPKDITEAHGYSLISLEFTIDGEPYRLERSIGSGKIDIIYGGEAMTLSCKHDATSLNNLSRYLLWLLLESDENVILRKNKTSGKRTMSFRDIVHLCTVAETDIIAESSAFQSIQYTEKTVRKSVLKYIITGFDDGNSIEADNAQDENIRRAGVVQFLQKKRTLLQSKIEQIEQDKSYQLYLADSNISGVSNKIKLLRKLISEHQAEISKNLLLIEQKKQECFKDELRISEFEKLRLHYSEELKRNGMISTYADFLMQLPHLGCPICNQMLNPNIITSENGDTLFHYFLEKNVDLQNKIEDLSVSLQDISYRLKVNQNVLEALKRKNATLYDEIAQKQSIIEKMSENIAIIRQLDAMKKALEIYKQELISVESDIIVYSEKAPKKIAEPVAKDITLYDDYCRLIETVLKKWGFSDDISVSFDSDMLDLYINGKSRSGWGKGYRAFIMSAMVIGLMRYCYQNNRLHPGFVIIDSPLVSLKERKKVADEQWVNDYMEKKMIEDILNQDSLRQVIIFENKDLKYEYDYNYIEFSHDGGGRKGFIY